MTISSQAPARADLAGGTLDIWPLYLFHEDAQTLNFAINYYARCTLTPERGRAIRLVSRDLGRRASFASLDALKAALRRRGGMPLALSARLLAAFAPEGGLTLTTDSDVPAGSGLGGSSAMSIAIGGALSRFTGRRLAPSKLIEMVRNVEAQVLGVPAGEQDYYAAVHGGVQAIRLTPGGVRPEKLPVDPGECARRFLLCYTGQSRHSGINNWEVFKARVDRESRVCRQFRRLAAIARDMRLALEEHDWSAVARLLRQEWAARKRNHPGITTPRIDRLVTTALRNGAWAAKVCGAGGGGGVLFLIDPAARGRLEQIFRDAGARPLPFQVPRRGLRVSVSP